MSFMIYKNYPRCWCGSHDLKVIDIDLLDSGDDRKFFLVTARCQECHKEDYYYLDRKMENRY